MIKKQSWIPACAGMTEEGHLDFYFREDKKSFLRKQESINLNFHSHGLAKLAHERLVWLLFFLFCQFSMSLKVYGQTDIHVEESKTHFNKGVELFRKGDFRGALAEFEKSYNLRPHWGILYNIGVSYLKLDNKGKALMVLTKFLEQGGAQIPADKEKEVEDFIKNIMAEVGILRFIGNLEGAVVLVDGETYPEANENLYLYLDAGLRYVRVVKGSKVLYENKVLINKAGEVTIYLEEGENTHKAISSKKKEEEEKEKKEGEVSKEGGSNAEGRGITGDEGRDGKQLKKIGYAFAGIAGVLAIGYAIAGGMAISEKNKMNDAADEWNNKTSKECNLDCEQKLLDAQDDVNTHHDLAANLSLSANILFGLTVASAVVSVSTLIIGMKKESSSSRNVGGKISKKIWDMGFSNSGVSMKVSF